MTTSAPDRRVQEGSRLPTTQQIAVANARDAGYRQARPLAILLALITLIAALPAISALQGNTGASDVSPDNNTTRSVAIADLDNDGFPDLVVANESNTEANQIFWGDGSGGFEAGVELGAASDRSDSVDIADVDGDLDLDILIGNRSAQPNRLYENQGSRSFNLLGTNGISDSAISARQTSDARFGDLNQDGDPDVVVANRGTRNIVFLADNLPGGKGFPTRADLNGSQNTDSSSIAIGDLNGDDWPDIVIGNRENARNDLYINTQNDANAGTLFGSRRDLSADANYTDWVVIADLNNDGRNDVILANRQQPNQYLINRNETPANNDNLFEKTKLINGDADYTRELRVFDVDGDGDLDVVVANDTTSQNKVYLNLFIEQGETTVSFSDGIPFSTDFNESTSIAVCGPANPVDPDCDLDGDGDNDIVLGNNGSPNRLYTDNNEDPLIISEPVTGATASELYEYTIVAADPDFDQTLTISSVTAPAWLNSLVADPNDDRRAIASGTPTGGDVGDHNVSVTVSDGDLTATQDFVITVAAANAAPAFASAPPPATITQSQSGVPDHELSATDDGPLSELVFSAPLGPDWVTITNNGDGTATLVSDPEQVDVGEHELVLRVTDAGGRIDEQSLVVTVQDGNDRPLAVDDIIQLDAIGEVATTLTTDHPFYGATSLFANDRDADGDTLSFVTITIQPTQGTVTVNADGTFEYTHTGTDTTPDTFRYRVADGNGGQDLGDVEVRFGPNLAPIANDDGPFDVSQGGSIQGSPSVLDNDEDPDGPNGALVAQLVTPPEHAAVFSLNPNDGTFEYTHNGNAETSDSFTYLVRDEANIASNEATVTLNITPDTTPPEITVDPETVTLAIGDTWDDAAARDGVTATDNVDGDITANIVVGGDTVDTNTEGTYTVTYNVSDAAGNPAVEATRTVNVTADPDTTPPVITLVGPATVNVEEGGAYTEQGATAQDDVDGDISANVVIGGDTVDTNTIGTYVVTYNVSDSSGNAADEVTRTVNVVAAGTDTTPPVITLNGDAEVTLTVGDTYTEEGATAEDDVDGDISDQIVIGGDAVDTATAGTYVVTYNVSDAAGNAAAEVTRTVTVEAAPPPPPPPPPSNGGGGGSASVPGLLGLLLLTVVVSSRRQRLIRRSLSTT